MTENREMLKAGEKASDQFARAWSCARDSLLNAWSMSCGPMALLVNYRMELKQRAHSPQISEWMQGNPRIILYNATSSRLYGQRSKRQRDAEATAKRHRMNACSGGGSPPLIYLETTTNMQNTQHRELRVGWDFTIPCSSKLPGGFAV
jgi:hypothetical protein